MLPPPPPIRMMSLSVHFEVKELQCSESLLRGPARAARAGRPGEA